jgi:hypothetical protein
MKTRMLYPAQKSMFLKLIKRFFITILVYWVSSQKSIGRVIFTILDLLLLHILYITLLFFFFLSCQKAELTNPMDPFASPIATLYSMYQPPPLALNSFELKHGIAGTEVTITGTGFSKVKEENSVKFNETSSEIISTTSTSLVVKVPEGGATTGKITVAVSGQTVESAERFIVPPQILSFDPKQGVVGTTITIVGTNFSTVPAENIVKINGVNASLSSSTNVEIKATVPISEKLTDVVSVETNGFTATSTETFSTTVIGSLYNGPNMTVSRYDHTATLLNNGKVLVTGGIHTQVDGTSKINNSVELYDPDLGVFTINSPSMDMKIPRASHTETLLANGNVLIAGGYRAISGSPVSLSSFEIFDINTMTFTVYDQLNTGRHYHTATRLKDGRVLITGGSNAISGVETYLSSTEIYDPATNTFTTVGSMTSPRVLHTVTLLNNGKVLIVGGGNTSGNLSSYEIFDPTTNTFTFIGSFTKAVSLHTATLLQSGKVLIYAGADRKIYNPDTNNFIETSSETTYLSKILHTSVLLSDGKVFFIGGGNRGFKPENLLNYSEIYNPSDETFTITGNIHTKRISHTATLLNNGKVIIIGGHSGDEKALSSSEIYTP